MLEELRFQLIH